LIEGTHEGACHEIERIRSAEKERSWRH